MDIIFAVIAIVGGIIIGWSWIHEAYKTISEED